MTIAQTMKKTRGRAEAILPPWKRREAGEACDMLITSDERSSREAR
jgi:hypothetical protein